MKALHVVRSFTIWCQLCRLVRYLWTTSIHVRGVLHFPWGLHSRICHCGRWVGIRIRWPNHWSLLSLSWSLMVVSPHSSRTSALRHLSHKVRSWISRKNCIWKVVSLRISFCVTAHVSIPQRRVDITIVQKTRTLVDLLRFRLLKILRLSIWYTVLAFFNHTVSSFSTPVAWPTSLPRYGKTQVPPGFALALRWVDGEVVVLPLPKS